jgi:WD40 repeat protein
MILHDTDQCHLSITCRGHMGSVYGLAMSPLNTYFASASADLSLKLWSPEFAFPLRTFAAHTQPPLVSRF